MRNTISRKITILLVLMCVISSTLLFASCGKAETINGTWVLVKQVESDGTVKEGNDIAAKEKYIIADGVANYSCEGGDSGMPDVGFQLTVVEKGNNMYDFVISDTLTFVSAEIKGKNLIYSIASDNGESTTFYFEKQKSANKLEG